MMRLDQLFSHLNRPVAKLRQKYLEFSNGVVRALIEEEMKIRREEIDAQVNSSNRSQESRGT